MELLKIVKGLLLFIAITFLANCSSNINTPALFKVLDASRTGLNFTNTLLPTDSFNMFNYMYFYNGAGVGAGDFNNDGLVDIFFSGNQQPNRLYINKGNLEFDDVTNEAKIPNNGSWNTGVSVVDINNDGLLDIYVCCVGKFETLHGKNQLLVCQGMNKNATPFYRDEAAEYGLDFSGFGTQAAFLDYDGDGDLDMFLVNHPVHQNGSFAPRKFFTGTYSDLSGDRIYRNDGGHFIDVTKETGINSSANGFGLGVCVADINLDGWPDIYVGNDFYENDYLYINQKDGTFKEDLNECMMHTSHFSMGVDVADMNNDALPDIISIDMLPSDPYILRRSLGEGNYNLFYERINQGYNYQYPRNNLQLNCGNGMFSEVGLYAGIAATDWSWAPLWLDFDNDGLKDLFISNGIPKQLNDIDYISFVSNEEVQKKIKANKMEKQEMALINKFPEIKLYNKFFKNNGDESFSDVEPQIQNNKITFSNGAVYADFDNDGDLDVVVNNIGDPVLLYENKTNDKKNNKNFIELNLKGPPNNLNAIGSKLLVFEGKSIRAYEKYAARGFQSSMEIPFHLGIANAKIDSVLLVWPDRSYQKINWQSDTSKIVTIQYENNLPRFDFNILRQHRQNETRAIEDITKEVNLQYDHKENPFVEFDREPLIPHMVSTEGPALAIGDINHDGLDDVFIGSSKRNKSAIFLQSSGEKFIKTNQVDLDKDSMYEDVDACWADVNNDKKIDLVVASGGNEFYGKDEHMQPRVYLNDGNNKFKKSPHAFDNIYLTASCVLPCDFNNDGYVDLFIGARTVPWHYGEIPHSYLLLNDGSGKFKDVGDQNEGLSNVGMVTQGAWFDMDKDGDKDLLLSLEWDGIIGFVNNDGRFTKKYLTDKKGWWNFVLPCDIDNDGDADLIAGNLGLNSRLKASDKTPVNMYYNDFDDNGNKEQILTYYLHGQEIPFASMEELQKQMPFLKKKYLRAEDFAKASLQDLFTQQKLNASQKLTANFFSNSILINDGKWNFKVQALPAQAQFTSYRDAVIINANNDNFPDVLLVGNFYDNNVEMGRSDADYGTVLINRGNDKFSCEQLNGIIAKGQTRHIKELHMQNRTAYLLARNNDSAMVIKFRDDF
jgi:hypothetical protein